ncbi:hypothetical protein [Cryptosporangium aurantiacum]|uniref:Uncharacterized protein n=1 Tax=Cryptosporangium aurantiacum TaxID=134849 RepID=A0A1M7RLX7_9ACTN|nr:hypothetical protein [Cryptosporangium aurantiacum]SHN47126.1 hypothetical protein SAMN05443668_12082 [Cryptosporangium aurantiacum]
MHNVSLAFEAAWKVLLIGLVLGAGLPTLFAFGIRTMAWGQGGEAEVHAAGTSAPPPHPGGRAIGILCFALVVAAVALGIAYIVLFGLGKELSFEHIYPTIQSKD